MGREIKRVPLDFDHPLGERWPGFVPPKWRDCPERCEGGYSPLSRAITGPLRDLMNNLHDVGEDGHKVIAAMLGEDMTPGVFEFFCTSDLWKAERALLARAGLGDDAQMCTACGGHGIHPEDRPKSESWESSPPPTGEGWQVWETVSEGSPVTPVFETAEALALYLSTSGDLWEQRRAAEGRGWGAPTYEQALAFVSAGWGPSMLAVGGRVMGAVEAAAEVGS